MFLYKTNGVIYNNLPNEKYSGIARVIVLGRQVASGEGILGGLPPPNFYTDLDFLNGLEHN